MSSASTLARRPLPSARGRWVMAVLNWALREWLGPTSQCRVSKAWVPSAPSTPPPAAAWEYQLQGREGSARLPISQSYFTSTSSPRTPLASRSASCWNRGTARYSKSTATVSPRCRASRCRLSICSALRATGFSSSKCLPASRARRARSKRGPGGVAITIASTAGLASSSSKLLWPGSSALRQAASSRSGRGCQRATGSVPGQARNAGRCTASPKPRPAMATFSGGALMRVPLLRLHKLRRSRC